VSVSASGGEPGPSFDPSEGSLAERLIFGHRALVVALVAAITALLGWHALGIELRASFEATIPRAHPYVAHYLEHASELDGLGNRVRIAVENRHGSIYDAAYIETLRRISDEVFLVRGVDRPGKKSLWTPATRWLGVTEEGLDGGPVIPEDYDGSAASLEKLRANVLRSGEIGQLVAPDARSTVIQVPLLPAGVDGRDVDYARFSQSLEELRARYEGDAVAIHITGFAKVVGELIEGLTPVLWFFAIAAAIAAAIVYAAMRDGRSTLLVVACSLIAVVWQLGAFRALGFALDPYSMLVPFLVFAIGMSHGVQKMNGITQDVARGAPTLVAARLTFRRLFGAGLTALLADAAGFAALMTIDIGVIRQLALAASLGVAALIFTNLILLPVLISYVGVGIGAAARARRELAPDFETQGEREQSVFRALCGLTHRRRAVVVVVAALALAIAGGWIGADLEIGDLQAGAPELRADSRYNRDSAFMNAAYGASSDVFGVMITTPENECAQYDVLIRVDALEWELRDLPGVESTASLAQLNRGMLVGLSEGSFKWFELVRNQRMLNYVAGRAPAELRDARCHLLTLYVYLRDHKARTLARVAEHVAAFAASNDTEDVRFLLAAGNAGIEAATNSVVRHAWREIVLLVFAIVSVLCLVAFRSWRAMLVAMLPLLLTSILVESLMVLLGIGVKVATLPVIALGVGIGVDYAIYVVSVLLRELRTGRALADAYRVALLFTGRVVLITGMTLCAAVATWTLSPIKLQADMGILLAFMFAWNMLGALVLIPSLAAFLLPSPAAASAIKGRPRPRRD
jgi:predicted RND superfamily exporter protein